MYLSIDHISIHTRHTHVQSGRNMGKSTISNVCSII